jgi:hypothetical protein
MPNKIPKINLNDQQQIELVNRLDEMSEMAEQFHGQWSDLHGEYKRLYRSMPEHETRMDPWEGASNFVVPLITTTVNSTAAMVFDAMFAQNPSIEGVGWEDAERAKRLERWYFDMVYNDRVISLREFGNDWNLDDLIDGTSCVKARMNMDQYLHREHRYEHNLQTQNQTMNLPILGNMQAPQITGMSTSIVEDPMVRRSVHPTIEVCNMERIKVCPGSGPSLQWPECPWYFEEVWWDEATLAARKRAGGWSNLEDAEKAMTEKPETHGEKEEREDDKTGNKRLEALLVRVFYARYVLPGRVKYPDGTETMQRGGDPAGIPEECVMWYSPELRKLLRVVPLSRIRPDGQRPHIDNRWIRVPRNFYGIGIPAQLRHVEALMNTTFNQMVDYGHLRNVPWGFYDPTSMGIQPDEIRLEPGTLIPTMNPGAVNFQSFTGDNNHWLQLLQQARQFAEQLTQVTDFTMGRAPSTPNAPRTARGQGMLMQQATMAFSFRVALMALAYRRVFRAVHVLYQKHPPADLELKMFNGEMGMFNTDMKITRDDFKYDADFTFRLNADKNEKATNLQMQLQVLTPLFMQMQNIEGLRTLHKELYDVQGLKGFDSIWPNGLQVMPQMPGQAPQGQPGAVPGLPGLPGPTGPLGPQLVTPGMNYGNEGLQPDALGVTL